MKYALVINGAVDTISFEPQIEPWVEVPDDIFAGFTQNEDGTFSAPPPAPPPVPTSLSFAQLLIGLVSEQWISEFEGEQWLQGVLPPQVTTLIETLPPEQQFAAKARASRPSEVLRADPMVVALGAAQGKTPEELDQFFRTYAGV